MLRSSLREARGFAALATLAIVFSIVTSKCVEQRGCLRDAPEPGFVAPAPRSKRVRSLPDQTRSGLPVSAKSSIVSPRQRATICLWFDVCSFAPPVQTIAARCGNRSAR